MTLRSSKSICLRACSCLSSGGSATSGQPRRTSVVRANSCPISGGSSFSGQRRRPSVVRACSCPIWGGSTSSLLPRRSSSWTRSSLHVTPLHERGLSPSGHHSCSAGLAARIARSVTSSGFSLARDSRASSAIFMALRPSVSASWASRGVALKASPSQFTWAALVQVRMHLKKAGTASGLATRKACS
eukprot:scaffold45669_cov62-Phaeocystis_antarctica.AAC.2